VGPLERLRRKSSAKGRELLEVESQQQDPAGKLDQDYIQMFLGKLEPMQESRLVQLKQCMTELQKDKAPSDPVVLRFLRARDFNVEKAREMLSASLIWRKKHGVDKILSEYQVRPFYGCAVDRFLGTGTCPGGLVLLRARGAGFSARVSRRICG
jgi:hypothetical protein